jgi:hypothetical protein
MRENRRRTDFDSHSTRLRLYLFEHRPSDFENETSSIDGRATVFILTKIRGAIHELSDQIDMFGLDLYTVESGFHRIPCRDPKFSDRAANATSTARLICIDLARGYGQNLNQMTRS